MGLAAQVSFSGSTAPTGALSFTLDGATPTAAGCSGTTSPLTCTATVASATMAAGIHTLTAIMNGDRIYNAATGNASLTVSPQPTSTVTVTPASIPSGTPAVNLAAQVSFSGSAMPHGTLSFTVDGSGSTEAICSGTSSPLSCTASFSSAGLSAGTHTLTATLAADSIYRAATGNTVLSILLQPTSTVSVTPASIVSGTALVPLTARVSFSGPAAPTGALNFLIDGVDPIRAACTGTISPLSCTASLASAGLGAGTHILSATLSGDDIYTANGGASTLTVSLQQTSLLLTENASDIAPGQTLTIGAFVTSAMGTLPTGSVTFMDGTTELGTVILANGQANLFINNLSPGTHHVTATYSGASDLSSCSSSALSISVTPLDFILTPSNASAQSISPGATATFNLHLAPLDSVYPSSVTLTVTGLPAGSSYTINPAMVDPTAGAQDIVLTLHTTALTSKAGALFTGTGSTIVLGMIGLPLALLRKQRNLTRKAGSQIGVSLLVILVLWGVTFITGCGEDRVIALQPPSSYALTVIANSAGMQRTAQVTLNVQ